MKWRSLLIASELGSVVTLSSLPAHAITPYELLHSSGDTQYRTENGWTSALVYLRTNKGSYITYQGTGEFTDVQYDVYNAGQSDAGVTIYGLWSLNGESGTFQWYVRSDYSFSGCKCAHINDCRQWTGDLSPSHGNANGSNSQFESSGSASTPSRALFARASTSYCQQ